MGTGELLADFLSTREKKVGQRHQAQFARCQGDARCDVETMDLVEASLISRARVVVVVVIGSDFEKRRRRPGQDGCPGGKKDRERTLRPLTPQIEELLVCECLASGPVAWMQENMHRSLSAREGHCRLLVPGPADGDQVL